MSLPELEKRHIERVLKVTAYNTTLASNILNIPRTTLWRRIKKYGLAKNK
jgi:transcriptional regulator with PAS, ATPase and Fis domain